MTTTNRSRAMLIILSVYLVFATVLGAIIASKNSVATVPVKQCVAWEE